MSMNRMAAERHRPTFEQMTPKSTSREFGELRTVCDPSSRGNCGVRIHDLRHTFASLPLQQGESIVHVKEQLARASIQISVDTYGHLIPGANRAAVDGLDDLPRRPNATQAQPPGVLSAAGEGPKSFEWNGDPKFHELEPARRVVAAA
jgi:hypothetical protein